MTLQAGKMYRPTDVAFDIDINSVYVVEQFNHRVSKWIYPDGFYNFSLADGNVTDLTGEPSGSGYADTASLVIDGPTGTATAIATVTATTIASIAVTAGGTGYTTAPNVEIVSTATTGTLATATATIEDGIVIAITVTNVGSGYVTTAGAAPEVVIDAPEGKSRATGVATVGGGQIDTVTLTGNGNGYTGAPTVTIVGNDGNGNDAAITTTFTASTWGTNDDGTTGEGGPIGDGGSGDTSLDRPSGIVLDDTNDLLYVTDTFHNRVRVIDATTGAFTTSVGTGGTDDDEFYHPAGIAINVGTDDTVVIADELNSRAVKYNVTGITLDTPVVLDVFSGITSFIIDTPGSGFTGTQTVTVSAPASGTTATATVVTTAATGVINTISAIGGTNSGYFDGEAITLLGDGTGLATASATALILSGVIQSISFTDRGTAFDVGELVAITGAVSGTAGATFTVDTVAANGIRSITIATAGDGYTGDPTVTITGTAGTGATASTTIGGLSFIRPHGMTYDETDSTFNVGDSLRSVITSFNDAGTFQDQFGIPRSNGLGNTFLFYPGSGKGKLPSEDQTVFANTRNNRVRAMEDSAIIQVQTGTNNPGTGDGQFYWPETVSAFVDNTDPYILVSNTYNNRVEVFSSGDPNNDQLDFEDNFGSPGSP